MKREENLLKLLEFALSEPEINETIDRKNQFQRQKVATDLLTIGQYLAEDILFNDKCVQVLDEFIRCKLKKNLILFLINHFFYFRKPSTSEDKSMINPLTLSFYTSIIITLFNAQFSKVCYFLKL